METNFDRTRYDDYQFGITRATGAIAESGTVIIDDDRTSAASPRSRRGSMSRCSSARKSTAPFPTPLAALGDSPNIIWCTGPSKTADVEGILIEGVHGPGEQIALLI